MKFRKLLAGLLAVSALQMASNAMAATVINPTSDGSLYVCDGCNSVADDSYVLVSGYIQGSIKFSTASLHETQSQVLLSLNAYALPLFGPDVRIYGYGTSIGYLDVSDADAGTFLGTLTISPNVGFGTDSFFDVTSFVNATHADYVAFNLRTEFGGMDVFSSLEHNYGHPAQLLATAVPEPASASLLLGGLVAMGASGIGRIRRTARPASES